MSFGSRSGGGGGGSSGPDTNVNIDSFGGVPVAPAAVKGDGMSNAGAVPEMGARTQLYNGTTWDRGRSGFVGVVATFVGYQNSLPYAIFHTAPAARADGSGGPLEADAAGNLRTAMNSWLGSSAPTVGQKAMVASIPVVIASDQSPIAVTGSFASASVGAVGAAAPASADQAGFVNATGLLEPARVYDTDTGAGVENTLGVVLRASSGGGSVETGTIGNPFVVAAVNNLSGTMDQGTSNGDPTDGWSVQLTDGTNFYTAANAVPTVNSPNATSANTASLVTNFGTDGSIPVKGSPGNVFSCSVSHDGTTKRYIQLFDKASAPANGDTPLLVFVLPPATATIDSMTLIGTDFFGTEGTHFSVGISIGVSSTKNTFTEDGTSEKAFNVKFK